MPSWTYDPTAITGGGIHQLRFELGDTEIEGEGSSAALCDEEYTALLEAYGESWRRVRFEALKAIVMKMSYEVDTSIGGSNYSGLSYQLGQRYPRWKALLEEEQRTMAGMKGVPVAGDPSSIGPPPYFSGDMHRNPRRR